MSFLKNWVKSGMTTELAIKLNFIFIHFIQLHDMDGMEYIVRNDVSMSVS